MADVRISAAELEDVCARAMEDLGIVGAQAAIVVGDELVEVSLGTANIERNLPVTGDTVFQVGSTAKMFTATAMMQLADEGRVDIDVPVTTYLPDVRLAADGDWRSITARHLMSMSSGLDNGPYADTGRGDDCVAKFVELIDELPMHFAPGTSYGYSNSASVVSGLLIERIVGASWDDVLQARVLVPGGLDETVSLFDRLPFYRVALGGYPGGIPATGPWNSGRAMGPSGTTVASSARDLARFGSVFLRGGLAADGRRLLSRESVAAMQSPQIAVPSKLFAENWCVGSYHKQWGDTAVWGHSGTTLHGSSTLIWIPERGLSMATNVNTPPRGYPFADAVFDAILRDRFGIAKPPRPVPGDFGPVDLERYLGRYESWAYSYDVTREGDELVAAMRVNTPKADGSPPEVVRSVLRPIAPHRFLPENDEITGFHTWDLAFTLRPGEARAGLLHNGAFTAPRAS